MTSTRSRLWTIALGFAVSSVCLWGSFRDVDTELFFESIALINWHWLVVCSIALLIGAIGRSLRWRLLGGFEYSHQFSFTRATILGILSNLIFPARAGEVVKIACAVKFTRAPITRVLASAICDRFVDLGVLLFVAITMCLFTPAGDFLNRWVLSLIGVAVFITLAFSLFIRHASLLSNILAKIFEGWLSKWSVNTGKLMVAFRQQFNTSIKNIFALKLLLIVFVVLASDYFVVSCMLRAFSLSLGIEVPFVLWVFLAAGSALPSAPGYIGVYQLAAVWTLHIYGVAPSISVGIATVLQIITLLTILLAVFSLEGAQLFRLIKYTGTTKASADT